MTPQADSFRVPTRARIGWWLAAAFFLVTWVIRVSPSVMINELMRAFDVGGALLGNLSAYYFYAYGLGQLPAGILHDRRGPRLVGTAAALMCAAGAILFALAPTLFWASVARFLAGFGSGFAFVGALVLATSWFSPRRIASLTGIAMMLGLLGGFIGQGPLAALVDWIGWRESMLALGVVSLVYAIVYWIMVRDRPPEAEAAHKAHHAETSAIAGLLRCMKHPQTWVLATFGCVMSAPLLTFGGLWGVPYAIERYGLSRPAAAFLVSSILIGWAAGAPTSGWISDRLGRRRRPMIWGACIGLAAILVAIYVPGLPQFAFPVALFFAGFGGSFMAIAYITAAEHNSSGGASGAVYGLINMTTIGAGALLQPLVGAMLDWQGASRIVDGVRLYSEAVFQWAFMVLPACYAIGLICSLLVRETFCAPVRADPSQPAAT
ncbi:MAG: nitrate/nitrite transporter [Alphaproteobacteria bacterium]